ncbi:MAG TPA: 7-carboxy-7-deazaguanine synthase QueE [Sedimentisphaerales bacterium]|nr:7-carboxy-7-deazaguanine synthase QueE [Sedimentisphaerales bacterium]
MRVSEIFYSLQGEGTLVGVPSVFVRLAGCPLRCRWCDTKYAWDESAARSYSIAQVLQAVQAWRCRFVVITGGEPMISSELPGLAEALRACGKEVTIETAGIAFIPNMPCDLMSISPKLSNSTPADPKLAVVHEDARLDIAVVAELIRNYRYQIKFVVDSAKDVQEIQQVIAEIGSVDSRSVMLMPQGRTRDEVLARSPMVAEICKRMGFVFCQRLQVILWNNERKR